LATAEDKNPKLKVVENAIIAKYENCEALEGLLEKRKLNNWFREPGYVQIIWEELRRSDLYKTYTQTRTTSFKEDKDFIIAVFKKIVAPNEKIHDYLEDTKLTWMDDLPIVNTAVVKTLKKIKDDVPFQLPRLFKNEDDRDFAFDLLNKCVQHQD